MTRTLLPVLALIPALALAEPPTKYSPPQVDKETQKKYREMAKKNECPNGISWLDGNWTFAGESKVPNFTDTLTISGLRYEERLSGGPAGKEETGVLTGDYACLFKNRILMRLSKATPEGAFGNRSGDDYPCDVLTPVDVLDKDRFLLVCFVDWDLRTVKGLDFEYKRIAPSSGGTPPPTPREGEAVPAPAAPAPVVPAPVVPPPSR